MPLTPPTATPNFMERLGAWAGQRTTIEGLGALAVAFVATVLGDQKLALEIGALVPVFLGLNEKR